MKKMLILRMGGGEREQRECDTVRAVAQRYGIEVYDAAINEREDLRTVLVQSRGISYLYLSANAKFDGFASKTKNIRMSWLQFGSWLSSNRCLAGEATVLFPSTNGALYQAAFDLFYSCPQISYVIGPPSDTVIQELAVLFEMLLFGIEYRNTDPFISAQRATNSTDVQLMCFERMRTQTGYGFLEHIQNYDPIEIMELNETTEDRSK